VQRQDPAESILLNKRTDGFIEKRLNYAELKTDAKQPTSNQWTIFHKRITADELWTTSKVYCANSFHLEIEYSEEEQTLKLLGDKISYSAMREFTTSVVMNLLLNGHREWSL
jgi:hypothetical protein